MGEKDKAKLYRAARRDASADNIALTLVTARLAFPLQPLLFQLVHTQLFLVDQRMLAPFALQLRFQAVIIDFPLDFLRHAVLLQGG
ncbi:hypothetical protein CSQ94_13585 [Janthinobacterium sp. BJB312]|nr:hypothetical protein CSQ94_13585 [Janthinobacterium sp. BJB312]